MDAIRQLFQELDPVPWRAAELKSLFELIEDLEACARQHDQLHLVTACQKLQSRLSSLLSIQQPTDKAEQLSIAISLKQLEQLVANQLKKPELASPVTDSRLQTSPSLLYLLHDRHRPSSLADTMRQAGYLVQAFNDVVDLIAQIHDRDNTRPVAVIIDIETDPTDAAGIARLEQLRSGCSSLPPCILVASQDDLSTRLAALKAGAQHYVLRQTVGVLVLDLLANLTSPLPQDPYRVLIVMNEPREAEAWSALLSSAGLLVRGLSRPCELLEAMDGFAPDVLVLGMHFTEVSGQELAAVIRQRHPQRHLPILFLAHTTALDQPLPTPSPGGDEVLYPPVPTESLLAALKARAQSARHINAMRDRLETNLYERQREHLALNQHAIVSIADRAGKITYINDKFCEVSGYTAAELLGQNHRIVKSDYHGPDFYKQMWQTITQGKVWQGEICNRRKDGSLYWVESTITPFLDSLGKPYQYVSIRTDITHVKAAEIALRESQARLNFLVSSSPVTIYTCQLEPPYGATYISPSIQQLTGYSAQQFTEDTHFWADHIHPEDRQRILENMPKLLEHGIQQHEYRFRIKDGSYRWMHDQFQIVNNEADQSSEIIGFWVDITYRKRMEQELKINKERLRRGQVFANIGTWEWNIQTGDLFWSERIGPLFGYPEGELETSYDNFLKAIHPDDLQSVVDAVNHCIDQDTPYEIEHRVIWPDGSVRWLQERGAVIRDANGKPLQMLGVVQDIDDRKRAELALKERERQLREAQALARLGNWHADLMSGELNWSDEIFRIFGYEPGSFEPSVETFHAAVHPDDRHLVQDSEQRAQVTGLHDVIHRIIRPDGSIRYVHELAQAQTDEQGHMVRLAGTVQDITEQVEAEQALITARDEADRANRAKSEFLSSMSHELRTPMNAILGFGQLLEYDESLREDQQDHVKEILKGGRHLLDLINEVLDLAKIESGSIDLSLEPVEICPVVEDCMTMMRGMADKYRIQLNQACLQGFAVRADRVRLKQALLNLLSNAIKYNQEGGSVTLDIQEWGEERLRILVADTGSGIPPQRQKELFLPFNRLGAENSGIEGTGIGLTITRRIVEMMGGSVGVNSQAGKGSVFWIELPMETGILLDESSSDAQPSATSAVNVSHQQHVVLYIEDNPANLKLVTQILGHHKHLHLLTAHTPELGIELALSRRPELILLDINMPGIDGYKVLQILKNHQTLKPIPVVAITANAMPRDIERGKAAGFTDYLTKPLDVPRFHQIMDQLLGNTRMSDVLNE